MQKPENVVLVTTCMNREEYLLKSLRTWRRLGTPIIVLDYSSTIPVSQFTGATVFRVNGYQFFNIGKAKNSVVHMAMQMYPTAGFFFGVDCDVEIGESFALPHLDKRDYHVGHGVNLAGTIIFSREAFERTGGYDERQNVRWGDDGDFQTRLLAHDYRRNLLPQGSLTHQHHTRAERFENYDPAGKYHKPETPWSSELAGRQESVA